MNIVALSGGVGGAKLATGLAKIPDIKHLSIIANTADDFEHLGLPISPDIDTLLYNLSGLYNRQQGWGVADESWNFLEALGRLGGPQWFQLGDKDLATHIYRLNGLKQGQTLTQITKQLADALAIAADILPMTDSKVSTRVLTDDGWLAFQEYFVARQCKPKVFEVEFAGIEQAEISDEVSAAISQADAIIGCPSNPFVSVAPILAVPAMQKLIKAQNIPVLMVSPIIAGQAVKGPAAKMMQEMQMQASAVAVAEHYQDFASHFVIDCADLESENKISQLGLNVLVTKTLMKTDNDKKDLAQAIINWLKH